MKAGILPRTTVRKAGSIFVEAQPNGRIGPFVDLLFRNDNTLSDHTQIPEQNTILNAVARGQF